MKTCVAKTRAGRSANPRPTDPVPGSMSVCGRTAQLKCPSCGSDLCPGHGRRGTTMDGTPFDKVERCCGVCGAHHQAKYFEVPVQA